MVLLHVILTKSPEGELSIFMVSPQDILSKSFSVELSHASGVSLCHYVFIPSSLGSLGIH